MSEQWITCPECGADTKTGASACGWVHQTEYPIDLPVTPKIAERMRLTGWREPAKDARICDECGAVVVDVKVHVDWHNKIVEVDRRVVDAIAAIQALQLAAGYTENPEVSE